MGTRKLMAAVLRHPSLWGEGLRAAFALAPSRWWARPPFLPIADPAYLRWRLETAYGEALPADPQDVVDYLAWRKSMRRLRARSAQGSHP